MKLYTVTISGQKHYFCGDLSITSIELVDDYCLRVSNGSSLKDSKEMFLSLLDYMHNNLCCDVTPIIIEHIFRINL